MIERIYLTTGVNSAPQIKKPQTVPKNKNRYIEAYEKQQNAKVYPEFRDTFERSASFDGWEYGAVIRNEIRERLLRQACLCDEHLKVENFDSEGCQLAPDSPYVSIGEPRQNKKGEQFYLFENLKDMPDRNGLRGKIPLTSKNAFGIKFKMGKLQEAGINTIIDLRSEGECPNKIRKALDEIGFEYVNFPVEDCSWDEESVSKIGKYIDTINQGGFYVGCANGEARTDLAVAINYIFNPQADEIPQLHFGTVSSTRVSVKDNIKQIYSVIMQNPEMIKDWGWRDYGDFLTTSAEKFQTLLCSLV